MRVGYAVSDITPEPGITLCGFAARRNKPSTGVDDPLVVQAIAVEHGGQTVLLLASTFWHWGRSSPPSFVRGWTICATRPSVGIERSPAARTRTAPRPRSS